MQVLELFTEWAALLRGLGAETGEGGGFLAPTYCVSDFHLVEGYRLAEH
jgi:hypothetical protein